MRDLSTMAGLQRLLGLVLLLPFLVLTLVPAHVMPGRAADGTLTMVLCGDGIEQSVTIDLATGLPVEDAPAGPNERCDWAASQGAMADLGHPAPVLPGFFARPAAPHPASVALADAAATGLPPSTGPPALI
ncbi:MAG: hypothetical protein ACKO2N_18060 [Tabrizicola sp.]